MPVPGRVCCRSAVRARLSAGAAHTGVHDRGRHIRHNQDGVAAVPASEVAAVQQAPATGHGHARGHGVVDGLADRVRRARRVPGRLVRAGQLLDPVRVLARIGAHVAVRAQRLVQPHAVRHQPGAPGAGVRGHRGRARGRRGRAGVPAVRAPVQIAYGHRRGVRVRARPPPRRPAHDHHQHTAVQRHTHQSHTGRRRIRPRLWVRRGPVINQLLSTRFRPARILAAVEPWPTPYFPRHHYLPPPPSHHRPPDGSRFGSGRQLIVHRQVCFDFAEVR